jgi:hypothetical protein
MATLEVVNRSAVPEDAQALMQLRSGLMFTAALHPITRLKIADLLAAGPLTADELARRTNTNPDALYRVLRLLAAVGAFTESPNRMFALTGISQLLRADVPGSLRDMILWIGDDFHFKVWSKLSHSLETGQPAVEHAYGKACFDAIFGDPDAAYDFNMAMTCISRQIAPALLEAYDFSSIGTLMDVAGGHGAILCEVLQKYPHMKGILFDMPNVITEANCHICELKLEHRCQTLSGDFFQEIPAGADAYYLQHIIHEGRWALIEDSHQPAPRSRAPRRRSHPPRRQRYAADPRASCQQTF